MKLHNIIKIDYFSIPVQTLILAIKKYLYIFFVHNVIIKKFNDYTKKNFAHIKSQTWSQILFYDTKGKILWPNLF